VNRRVVLLTAAAATVVVVAVAAALHSPLVPWNRSALVAAAYLPEWDERSAASLTSALAHGVHEISPVWATVQPDGSLVQPDRPPAETSALAAPGVRLVPTIQDLYQGDWAGGMVSDVLTDAGTAARHVDAIVQAARHGGWAGVDVDYEQLPPTAGPAFTAFLTALADRLHRSGMVLSVDVPARADDSGAEGGLAYSYQVIGSIADEVRVMAYDHSWSTGPAGPIAPLPWVEAVVGYAVARVPGSKLVLGLATYGYDWGAGPGASLGAADAVRLAQQNGSRVHWDDRAAAAWFTYEQAGHRHTVWYEDARALARKQQVAVDHGLRGVTIWRLGGEDPQIWSRVAAATEGSTS
jgi:spore germination protein YaaH